MLAHALEVLMQNNSEAHPFSDFNDNEEWEEYANCQDLGPDLFHDGKETSIIKAKKVCAACPVSTDCLVFAMATKIDTGIWGGKTPKERRMIRHAGTMITLAALIKENSD